MAVGFAIFLIVHGLIHTLGFAKAFGLAQLPQLTQPISPFFGLLWAISALLFVAAGVSFMVWPRWWWAIGACAIAVSMLAIVPSWTDAKFGCLADLIALVGIIFGFLAQGPASLAAAYERDINRAIVRMGPRPRITDSDLEHLPEPVQKYLRGAGVLGRPRVHNFRARLQGRIRSGPNARWMPFTAEQYNFFDEAARFFYLNASMFLIPVQGYHRYVGPHAAMVVKAAALVPVANMSGDEMTQSETVTMFNDMCIMAPAALIDRAITWEPIDTKLVRASFTNAGSTIRAELEFNDVGELTNFTSDDRYQTSPDGKTVKNTRWSTPVRRYRTFGPFRLAAGGEGRWHEPGGEYSYIELTIDQVEYNVRRR
jgi:hypothetical protein